MRWRPKPNPLPQGEHRGYALFPVTLWNGERVLWERIIWREIGPYYGGRPRKVQYRTPDMGWPEPPPRPAPPPSNK